RYVSSIGQDQRISNFALPTEVGMRIAPDDGQHAFERLQGLRTKGFCGDENQQECKRQRETSCSSADRGHYVRPCRMGAEYRLREGVMKPWSTALRSIDTSTRLWRWTSRRSRSTLGRPRIASNLARHTARPWPRHG